MIVVFLKGKDLMMGEGVVDVVDEDEMDSEGYPR